MLALEVVGVGDDVVGRRVDLLARLRRGGRARQLPRIICGDFLKVNPGDPFGFPPPKMDLEHPESIEEPIPLFDAIVGNFPYVRADQIEKHDAGYLEFLRTRLVEDWFDEYPELFNYTGKKEQQAFEKYLANGAHRGCDREQVQHRLSTYADLYVHLFFHTARFLKPGGRMGIVTSNAWLDVNYGFELQAFFLKHFKIVAILESRCEPWFTEAFVNTVVTILERCDAAAERNDRLVKFVKVKKPLAELIPGDPVIDAAARWSELRKLAGQIEHAGRKYHKTHPLGMMTEEDEQFRLALLRQQEMLADVEREGKTVKWGRYLRAPDVYWDLISNGRLCLLRDIAVPKFGSKTRINEFFHVTPEVAAQFGIEEEYLWPLIKSPKDSQTISVDPAELTLRIFVCRRTKADLKSLGHTGALGYIDWGETQTYQKGQFKGLRWPEGTWVNLRTPAWYGAPNTEINTGQVFFSEAFGDKHVHRYSPLALVPDKRLYFLSPANEEISPNVVAAAINSSVTSLFLEVCGRVTMGDGVLSSRSRTHATTCWCPTCGN